MFSSHLPHVFFFMKQTEQTCTLLCSSGYEHYVSSSVVKKERRKVMRRRSYQIHLHLFLCRKCQWDDNRNFLFSHLIVILQGTAMWHEMTVVFSCKDIPHFFHQMFKYSRYNQWNLWKSRNTVQINTFCVREYHLVCMCPFGISGKILFGAPPASLHKLEVERRRSVWALCQSSSPVAHDKMSVWIDRKNYKLWFLEKHMYITFKIAALKRKTDT